MPYTAAQLRKFGAMERRGESPPADWRQYAAKGKKKSGKKKKPKPNPCKPGGY